MPNWVTAAGYTGTYAETYASGQNIPFRSLGEYTSKYEEYDYTENLNRWIQDEGTASAMAYLTRDGNFMNSMLVAQWDDSFIDRVVETMSNMYFRGKDGWKQIFAGETSQNQAREVLIALLDSYSGTVLDLSQPGLTGWAQVNGRNTISWEDKFKYDLEYVKSISLTIDLKIFFLTIKKVFVKEGINASETVTMEKFRGSK